MPTEQGGNQPPESTWLLSSAYCMRNHWRCAGDPERSAEKAGRGCAARAGGRAPGAVGQVSSLSFGLFNARTQG